MDKIREEIRRKVENFIIKEQMIEKGDRILLGVSGGADSVCLLCLLQELSDRLGFSLGVLHIEHGIRGEESLRDADFVRRLCREKELPFEQHSYDVPKLAKEEGLSEEEAGRKVRYAAFTEKMEKEGYRKTAVAHNLNDNAETMLFHLARGSALAGLSGIPAVRGKIIRPKTAVAHNLNDNAETMLFHLARGSALAGLSGIPAVRGKIIRPLLCLERREIEAYLAAIGQDYCQDRTNQELIYSRNRIRHRILPELEEINPKAVEHMGKTAAFIGEADLYLTREAKKLEEACLKKDKGEVRIAIGRLKEADPLLRRYLFMDALEAVSGKRMDLGERHLQDLEELLSRQSGKRIDLPYGMQALRSYEEVILKKKEKKEEKKEEAEGLSHEEWEISFTRLEAENVDFMTMIEEKPYTKYIDYDKMNSKPVLRTRQPEDYLILDRSGRKKSLRRYFIDRKIPAEERDKRLLLADGSHIVWILGERLSYAYYLTEQTKHILKIEAKKKEK